MKASNKINKNYIHLSLDDVIDIWKDLTLNELNYKSIFCNKTIRYLYYLHYKFRVSFHLYCYFYANGFSLNEATDKFAKEFTSQSHWLKFGFHSINDNTDYSRTSKTKARKDYEKTITELVRITGSSKCIDRMPRLHGFSGNRESMAAMHDVNLGINGLLCTDDNRPSYYLTKDQNNRLRHNHILFDKEIGIKFIRTSIRLEKNGNLYWVIWKQLLLFRKNKKNILVVFTHENYLQNNNIKQKLEKILNYYIKV